MAAAPYILYIPEIALEKIFSYLTYDEIAKNRIVCRKFDEIGSKMLSRGFLQLEKRHGIIYKRVKSLLPRRESERRAHPLSRHCDILQAVETRLSMLNMTYMKYIERNLLCFIPGKVLDEMTHVLNLVESEYTPLRTHQLLQELRDLSSMAMEHFDEHILPRIKEIKEHDDRRQIYVNSSQGSPSNGEVLSFHSKNGGTKVHFVQQIIQTEIQKLKRHCKSYKHHISYLTQQTQKLMQKMKKQNVKIKAQTSIIREQERKIQEQAMKIQEQESCLADIKKHMDEWDQKYKDLTTELIRTREEILTQQQQLKIPKKEMTVLASALTSASPSTATIFRSAIRPRMAQILMPPTTKMDIERKRKLTNLLPDIPIKLSKSLEEQVSEKNHNILERDKNDNKRGCCFIKSPIPRKRKMNEDLNLN